MLCVTYLIYEEISYEKSVQFQVLAITYTTSNSVTHFSDKGSCLKQVLCISVFFFRTLPSKDLQKVAEQFSKYNFQGLLVIGGFEVRANLTESSQWPQALACGNFLLSKFEISFSRHWVDDILYTRQYIILRSRISCSPEEMKTSK